MIPNLRCQRFQISSTGWSNISNRITTPVNATSIKVEIHNGMFNGWIAYDDLTLKQVGNSTNLLPDPGFENTTSGWTTGQLSDFPTTMLWKGTWGPGAPRSGTYSYLFSNWADGYWRTLQLAARAGEQYDLYAYIRGEFDADTTQGRFLIRAKFMDRNGAPLGYSDITAMYPGAISSWTRVGRRVTARQPRLDASAISNEKDKPTKLRNAMMYGAVHSLQRLLLRSYSARKAVRQVTWRIRAR